MIEATRAPAGRARVKQISVGPEHIAMAVVAVLAVGLILYPMAQLLWRSLFTDVGFGRESSFTFGNFEYLLTNPALRSALVITFATSISTTIFSVAVGTALGWATARTNMPGGRTLEILNIIPFFMSTYVGAVAWSGLAGAQSGLLNRLLMQWFGLADPPMQMYSVPGMVWVMSLFYIPYVSIFVTGSFRNMDPALEEAARLSGASNFKVARHITFPLVAPAVLSGALLVLVTSSGTPEVPLALGNPVGLDTLATLIWQYTDNYPPLYGLCAAMGTILLTIALVGVYLQRRVIMPRSFVTITGKGYRPGRLDLGRWRYLALAFNLLYLLCALVLPILILIIMATSRLWTGLFRPEMLTLEHFVKVLFEFPLTQVALKNSLILAVGGASVGVVLCTILSYTIYRSRVRGRAALDFVVMLPIAVPAIVMAMGLLITWVATPLYATLLVLLVAYVTRYMPIAQRNIAASVLAVGPELEECARLHGASWLRTMLQIMVPLLKPGIAAAWLLLFIIFMREMGMSILLYANGTEVMSVVLYRMRMEPGTIASFALVQAAILLAATIAFRRFAGTAEIAM